MIFGYPLLSPALERTRKASDMGADLQRKALISDLPCSPIDRQDFLGDEKGLTISQIRMTGGRCTIAGQRAF